MNITKEGDDIKKYYEHNDNCLCYALRFWNLNKEYKLYYDSNHVINLPINLHSDAESIKYYPIETFGYNHIIKSFEKYLDDYHLNLLNKYFNIN
jgi:hypothetical protein